MMKQLINSNKLLLPRPSKPIQQNQQVLPHPSFQFKNKQCFIQKLIPGMIFELIAVSKDDKLKEINIVVWNYEGEIEGTRYLGKPLHNIGGYKLKGIIKDYQIGQDYSIFGYCDSYKKIEPGMLLKGQLTKIIKRQDNIIYEFSLRNTVQSYPFILGIVNYRSDLLAIQTYQKEEIFPIQYLLSLNKEWQNPKYFGQINGKHWVRNSINPSYFRWVCIIKGDYLYKQIRIRNIQNQGWAKQYFKEGIALTKQMKYREAIQRFNYAIKIDETNPNIYVAKGCALANIKNYQQGLKQLEIALQLQPEHKEAKEYHSKLISHVSISSSQSNTSQPKNAFDNLISKNKGQMGGDYKFIHKRI